MKKRNIRHKILGGIAGAALWLGCAHAQNYATFPPSYQLLLNSASTGATVGVQGGNYYLGVTGTFGGATVTVQYVLSGTTYTLGAYTGALAAPALVCVPAGAQVSAVVSGGSGVSVSAVLAGTGSGPCSDASGGTSAPVAIIGQRPFAATTTITRPANTTAYAAGQIYSTATSGLNAFPAFALGIGNNTRAQITTISVCDTNGTAATRGQFGLFLFATPSPSGGGFNDAAAFAPTAAALAAVGNDLLNTIPSSATSLTASPAAYCYTYRNDTGQVQTDSSGNIYAAVEVLNTYTPASAESLTITVSGTY